MNSYKNLFHSFTIVLAGLMLTLCFCNSSERLSDGSKVMPEMKLVSASGNKVNLSSFKGKKVFVNLWATWCGPCVSEMPSIQQLYSNTNKKTAEFVLVAFDDDFETAKAWVKRKGFTMPVYAVQDDLPELFNVEGIPSTFIFNEEGKLVFSAVGSEDYSKPKFVKMLSAK